MEAIMFLPFIDALIICIVGLIFLIDIIPVAKDWFGRIHIGRYYDKYIWSKSITLKALKWLNNTPKIKVTDNTRLVVIDMLKGNYTKSAIQHWQEAALLLSFSESLKGKENKEVINQIKKYLNNNFDSNGNWKKMPEYIDGAILAYAIMKLPIKDVDNYKNAWDATWNLIKEHIGKDGTVQYRKFMSNYRYVDTVGFICPFLVLYGLKYKKDECIELAIKQIKEYEKFGFLEKHHIPCHAYEINNKLPLGLYGWGRGLGWFAIGLIDAWNELPEQNKYKSMLTQSVKKFAVAVIKLQQENGSWNWTVTRSESRADSSTTATLGWFMLNAVKIDEISKECLVSSEKAINYLMKVTRRDGSVDFSQGDTKDIGVYSMLFNILPFTQGFCIRLINFYLNFKVVKKNNENKNYKLS
jgi:unsaturated rhamnogalacturonyl hydrolase